ncbi:transcriptional repressor [Halothiobacillus sp.]|jgi:Fur family zinc uptake transcriptional regulator|uniref:transcriptional repressor n=1 Tax=Halothiobacillus sp. TaxID=1891311 RepID=UPI002618C755|nr:transcriptional repressor [Halothiobacillus sp.]MDD3576283.1 transcriptional repressor [Halothiobacillus sp.]MDD4966027.1 transcriptional repressor [Halothiobacillus sp.]MDY0147337.1 transcriptional repressor [Halothiobacillus sp.]
MSCLNQHDCATFALAHAEEVCLARGARLTPIRRAVLTEIWANHEATKAYDLIARLSSEGSLIKPPTVYRALDFLLAHGLIHRIESLNAFIGCHHPDTQHQAILMICDQCGTINEAASEPLNGILSALTLAEKFKVTHQSIELHGLCATCQRLG